MASGGGTVTNIKEDFLTCQICLEPYKKPKALDCLHTFCLPCLEGYSAKVSSAQGIPCPSCRKMTQIPTGGLQDLKSNFLIESLHDLVKDKKDEPKSKPSPACDNCDDNNASARCFDCSENLCSDCLDAHNKMRQMRRHKTALLSEIQEGRFKKEFEASQKLKCLKHEDDFLKFFCQNCKVPICINCKVVEHDDHKCVPIEQASKEQTTKLKESYTELSSRVETSKIAIQNIVSFKQDLSTSKTKMQNDIIEQDKFIAQQISDFKTKLLANLEEIHSSEQKKLDAEKDTFEMLLAALESSKELTKQVIEHGSDVQKLAVVKDIEGKLADPNLKSQTKVIYMTTLAFQKSADPNYPEFFGKAVKQQNKVRVLSKDQGKILNKLCHFCQTLYQHIALCDNCDQPTTEKCPACNRAPGLKNRGKIVRSCNNRKLVNSVDIQSDEIVNAACAACSEKLFYCERCKMHNRIQKQCNTCWQVFNLEFCTDCFLLNIDKFGQIHQCPDCRQN